MQNMRLIQFCVFFLFLVTDIGNSDYFARNADIGAVEKEFYLSNPRDSFPQFRGVSIAVLYSCIVETGSMPSDACNILEIVAGAQDGIKFHAIETHDDLALNFFATKRSLDEASFVDRFSSCGLTSFGSILMPAEVRVKDVKACLYKSSLRHLGFEIALLREQEVSDGLFRSIILHYTEY